jgi:hypothetical protein
MRKFVLLAAVLAIASPSLAFAGEAKKAVRMSDAEMDKVTAGEAPLVTNVLDFKLGNSNAPATIYIGAPNPVPDHQTKFDSVCCQTPSSPGAVR